MLKIRFHINPVSKGYILNAVQNDEFHLGKDKI
jgi:hypothetical protein